LAHFSAPARDSRDNDGGSFPGAAVVPLLCLC
jgi:hypothetical protein